MSHGQSVQDEQVSQLTFHSHSHNLIGNEKYKMQNLYQR